MRDEKSLGEGVGPPARPRNRHVVRQVRTWKGAVRPRVCLVRTVVWTSGKSHKLPTFSYGGKVKQEIIVEDICPNLNTVINKAKRHWGLYHGEKKKWNRMIVDYCRLFNLQPMETPVRVSIQHTYPDKRRRDPDNIILKFFLDAIVEAGIIPDDSFQYIHDISILPHLYEKGTSRTHIILETVRPQGNTAQ